MRRAFSMRATVALALTAAAAVVPVLPQAGGEAQAASNIPVTLLTPRSGVGALSASDWSNTNVLAVSAGFGHSCAIQGASSSATSGTVFCWGEGGSLGNGTVLGSNVPVQVSAGNGFQNTAVTAIAAGGSQTCAIEAGMLWCWGGGDSAIFGVNGNGTQSAALSPVKV